MGLGENWQLVYIIDYGLAKKFRDPNTGIHIPYRDNKKLTGTARYASVCTHLGIEQSRRDDMECLGYTLIYLLNGKLPWQGIQLDNRQAKYNIIKEKKQTMKIEDICSGQPAQFIRYLNYCRGLSFEGKPDYESLRKMFKDLSFEKQYNKNFSFDWVALKALGKMNPMESPNGDVTNIADCPFRNGGKPKRSGTELRVTEISTPKTIYATATPPTAQISIFKDVLKIPDKIMGSEMRSSIEETKVLDKNNGDGDFEREYDMQQIYTLRRQIVDTDRVNGSQLASITGEPNISQTAYLTNDINASHEVPLESHSCNFKDHDIEENSKVILFSIGDGIPNERMLPESISIPTAAYIHNKRHWAKYRNRMDSRVKSQTDNPKKKLLMIPIVEKGNKVL